MTTMNHTNTDEETLGQMIETGGSDRERRYFGEITTVDDWDCVLTKGSGKTPFDPTVHRPDQRRVNITIQLACRKADGGTYTLDQADIASGTKHKVTLGSLEALGIATRRQLRDLRGRYAEVLRVPTGRKYIAQKGENAGKEIEETALKFVRLFADADEAAAAEAEFYTPKSAAPINGRNVPQAVPAESFSNQANHAARMALLASLPALWQAAGHNTDRFLGFLRSNAAYAAHGINEACPEVIAYTFDVPF